MYFLTIPPLLVGLGAAVIVSFIIIIFSRKKGKNLKEEDAPVVLVIPAKVKDTTPIEVVLIAFYGIYDGKLFIQLANRANEIAYTAETEIEEKSIEGILSGTYKIFPDSFKDTGIKWPRVSFFEFDGQKIAVSGEEKIIECEKVKDIVPNFSKFVFSFIMENGKH